MPKSERVTFAGTSGALPGTREMPDHEPAAVRPLFSRQHLQRAVETDEPPQLRPYGNAQQKLEDQRGNRQS